MNTTEKDFYRTQREAGIHLAPWLDNAELARASGIAMGLLFVAGASALLLGVFAGALRLLAGAP